MGSSQSTALSEDDLTEMKALTGGLSTAAITALYSRFRRLDVDDSGTISYEEFLQIPELAMNPLAPRILAAMDINKTKEINFREFLTTMRIFAQDTPLAEKTRFAFTIYDVDQDGLISSDDLKKVVIFFFFSPYPFCSDTLIQNHILSRLSVCLFVCLFIFFQQHPSIK